MTDTLYIEPTQRVGAVGATGYGKSFWMARYLMQVPRAIIIDTKNSIRNKQGKKSGGTVLPNFKILKDEDQAIAAARKGNTGQIIYRPQRDTVSPTFWRKIRRNFEGDNKRNIVIYLDEAGHIAPSNRIDRDLRYLFQAGREGGIGMWWSAQRPNAVNNTLISESEVLYVFHLRVHADREALRLGKCGDSVHVASTLEPREFICYGVDSEIDGITTPDGSEAVIMQYGPVDAENGVSP